MSAEPECPHGGNCPYPFSCRDGCELDTIPPMANDNPEQADVARTIDLERDVELLRETIKRQQRGWDELWGRLLGPDSPLCVSCWERVSKIARAM